jgi:hypothetical protein
MTEEEVKTEARLYALELFATRIGAMVYRARHEANALSAFEAHDAVSRGATETLTLPGMDAAQSDMWASEIQDALSRLQSMLRSNLTSMG